MSESLLIAGPTVLGIFDPIGDIVGGIVGGVGGGVAGTVAGAALDVIASSMAEAVGNAIGTLATFWTEVPSPDVEGSAVTTLQGDLYYYMGVVAVLSVLVAGGRMAWEMKAAPAVDLLRSVVTLVLVSSGGVAAVAVLLQAGDGYSRWILDQSTDRSFGEQMVTMLKVLVHDTGTIGPIMAILLGLFAVGLALMQIVMMVFRSAALVIAVGVWPLSAAATNTALGRQWFTKITGWVLAFALYKPAAATVYAASFIMFGQGEGVLGTLMGLAAMVLALVAMPAMMKLAVPAVGGMAGAAGGGGGGLMSAAGSGAMMMAGHGFGGGGEGSGSGGGPTGAVSAPSMQSYSEGPSTSAASGSGGAAASGGAATGAAGGAGAGAGAASGAASAGAASGAAGAAGAGALAATGVGAPVAVGLVGAQVATKAIGGAARGAAEGGGPSGSNDA